MHKKLLLMVGILVLIGSMLFLFALRKACAFELVGWGENSDGQISFTGGDYIVITGGRAHTLAIQADGSLAAWGDNSSGQLDIPEGNNYVAIASARERCTALRVDGTVVTWGEKMPGETDPLDNDFVAIAAGCFHSIALRKDGSLVGWGGNGAGQIDVPPGNDYKVIISGCAHSIAIRTDGSLVGWGDNGEGQIDVPSGNDYIAIAAGADHSVALRENGSLVGWGKNWEGQIDVPSGNDYKTIAAACDHSLALRKDGSLVGWGNNWAGQIDVPSGNDYIAIAGGGMHSLALKTTIQPCAKVLFIVQDVSNIEPWEVEYKFRLEGRGFLVIPMGWQEITPPIDLSEFNLVYWTDDTGQDNSTSQIDYLIDALVEDGVPFMTANPRFAIRWGLGRSDGGYGGPEWLDDQTTVRLDYLYQELMNGLEPSPEAGDCIQIYREGGSGIFISAIDETGLSPETIRIASAYDTADDAWDIVIAEFPIGAAQPNDSYGHAPPTAPFIHLGMGCEVPDTNPYNSDENYFEANDHENFWTLFVKAAIHLTGHTTPCYIDTDKDGVRDDLDNCPEVFNPDQIDSDGDHIGDVCDLCPHDEFNDADDDGFCKDGDNCPDYSNPDQADYDKDGFGNLCDDCPYGDEICNDGNFHVDDDFPEYEDENGDHKYFRTIKAAMDAAPDGTVIILRPGVYREQITFSDKSIVLKSADPGNPAIVNATIIDGDQINSSTGRHITGPVRFGISQGNESEIRGISIQNAYEYAIFIGRASPLVSNCVITGTRGGGIWCSSNSSATIDNCQIMDNNRTLGIFETGGSYHYRGSGILCEYDANVTISNCLISNNIAQYGGGICCRKSSPTIINSTLSNNSADEGDGGGLYIDYASQPAIMDSEIINNSSPGRGGGIYICNKAMLTIKNTRLVNNSAYSTHTNPTGGGICCIAADLLMEDCEFRGNSAGGICPDGSGSYGGYGGGVYTNYDSNNIGSSVRINSCAFIENSATGNSWGEGGAIYNGWLTESTISNSTFSNNNAGIGGGIYVYKSQLNISHTDISKNTATGDGGGLYYHGTSLMITHCTFSNNESIHGNGGGIYLGFSSLPVITNCLINNNSAPSGNGNAIYCFDLPEIRNCVICNNGDTGSGIYGSSPYIVNSIIRGNGEYQIYPSQHSHPKASYCNVQGGYPGLGNIDDDPLFLDPENNDFSLSSGSPCIDSGHPRIYDIDGSRSDMGIYGGEGGDDPNAMEIIVNQDGSGDYISIQDAIDYVVHENDRIIVAGGNYTENLLIAGKSLSLTGKEGANATIINGGENGSVILLAGSGSTILKGFTLEHGDADWGGGINSISSSSSIAECIIRYNSADLNGGGIHCFSSSITMTNSVINNNSSDFAGCILFSRSLPSTIVNCTIANNSGGIDVYDSPLTITSSIVWNGSETEISSEGAPEITYSNIKGGYGDPAVTHNIDQTPLFMDPTGGNYRLQPGSPCIDAATSDGAPAFDLAGNARVDDPNAENSGGGLFPYYDMGAYEYVPTAIKSVDMNLSPGWSMISLPVKPENPVLSSLFPDAVVVYGYEKGAGYKRVNNGEALEIGRGYWILLNNSKTYTLCGESIYSYTFDVQQSGWLMIGGCTESGTRVSVDNGTIGVIYGYIQGAGYQRVIAETLESGQGYWILINVSDETAKLMVE